MGNVERPMQHKPLILFHYEERRRTMARRGGARGGNRTPTPSCGTRFLSRARLPVPPHGPGAIYIVGRRSQQNEFGGLASTVKIGESQRIAGSVAPLWTRHCAWRGVQPARLATGSRPGRRSPCSSSPERPSRAPGISSLCSGCRPARFACRSGSPITSSCRCRSWMLIAALLGAPRKPLAAGFVVIGVASLCNAVLGGYHAGIEWHFWPGPADCTGPLDNQLGGGSLLDQLQNVHVVRCDAAAWKFLGISLAGYNALISFAVAVIAGYGLFARRPSLLTGRGRACRRCGCGKTIPGRFCAPPRCNRGPDQLTSALDFLRAHRTSGRGRSCH